MSAQTWIVIVPDKSWTSCYGRFDSYEEATDWVRANGWHPTDVNIYQVKDKNNRDIK